MSYCDFCATLPDDNVHKRYHDNHYGFRISDDFELFGRLILEINQAGLSWETILKKENNFREAFSGYNYFEIAAYSDKKIDQLMQNAGIIRNILKINAVIYNAQQIIELKKEFGSFLSWIDSQKAKTKDEWVKIFKKKFKFVGGEIVNEFLMSIGTLEGAHKETCEMYTIIKQKS